MPIYAYRCEHCGHAQDVLQKVSDPVLTVCPACGQATYRKQVTAAGFQLKGSGWYVTDFKNEKKAPAKPAEGDKPAQAAEGAGKSEAKADPAAATNGAANGSGAAPADAKPAKAESTAAAPAAGGAKPPAPSGNA
jgi:putative FmdB family regulatory protein